jgi:hypothetical protein
MLTLLKNEGPSVFFEVPALLLAVTSVGLAVPLFATHFETGLVQRFLTTIFSAPIMLLAFPSMVCGSILETVTRGLRETRRLAYLQIASADSLLSREVEYFSNITHRRVVLSDRLRAFDV